MTQQPVHVTQSLLTTSKTQFHTHKTQTNTTKPITVKAELNITQKKSSQLQNTINPQPVSSTSTYQLRTTQVLQNTVKFHLNPAQPKPRRPQPSTIHPQTSINQPQPNTPKGQLKNTQNMFSIPEPITTKPHPIQSQFETQFHLHMTHPKHIATQSPFRTAQTQSITTQYLPNTSQPQSKTKQSQPHTTQPKLSATQSQPQTTQFSTSSIKHYPKTAQSQSTTTPQTQTIQPRPIKTQLNPTERTAKSQTKAMEPKLITPRSKPRKKQQKPNTLQSFLEQPQPTTSQFSTTKYQTTVRPHQQPDMKQHQKYKIKPKLTNEPNAYYSTTLKGLHTTELQQKIDHLPTSATIKHSDTNMLHGETVINPESKAEKPVQMPSEKSSTQKKPVNKKLPVSKMGKFSCCLLINVNVL